MPPAPELLFARVPFPSSPQQLEGCPRCTLTFTPLVIPFRDYRNSPDDDDERNELDLLRVENSMLRTNLTQLEAKLDRHVTTMSPGSMGVEGGEDSLDGILVPDINDLLVKIHEAKEEALKHSGGGGGSR